MHEMGLSARVGYHLPVWRSGGCGPGSPSRGETAHDGLQVTSDGARAESGSCSPAPRASNQVPCRDDLKCTAGGVAAKGAWRAWEPACCLMPGRREPDNDPVLYEASRTLTRGDCASACG